jgi:mono/diheme cytochrome c family protein
MYTRIVIAAVVGFALLVGATVAPNAQGETTVWDGVYTETQADRGSLVYITQCAECHGEGGLGGGMPPVLVGGAFSANFNTLSVGDLFTRNRDTMPVGNEAGLSRQEYVDVTAYMLRINGFPAGSEELPTRVATLNQIRYLSTRP